MPKSFQFTSFEKRYFFLALVIVGVVSLQHAATTPAWSPMVWDQVIPSKSEQAYYHEQLIPNAGQQSTHSVSQTVLPSGDVMAFWFAGSREGHKDVQIFQARFHQQTQTWQEPQPIVDVSQLGDDLGRYIGKIGNPLVFVDSKQRMWLFFVTVSYGGWAGSNVNLMFSEDSGNTWGTPKRLITSPFINVSTLVRNTMYELEDGSVVVPVYHEFAAQFPEILRVSAAGEVISKTRMYGHGAGIQPTLIEGEDGAVHALMRSGSHATERRVLSLVSQDEGQSWQDFKVTTLPNPNSAQIAVRVAENTWLWVGNHNEENRRDLTLAISHDLNGEWQVIHQLEQGKEGHAFSYPAIVQGLDGVWHLMYTYNRKSIKHVRFNKAWLDERMAKQAKAVSP